MLNRNIIIYITTWHTKEYVSIIIIISIIFRVIASFNCRNNGIINIYITINKIPLIVKCYSTFPIIFTY